jgi:enolase-phosphatase E1
MSIRAIITDIEGTTTDIHFVHKVLFPYATQSLPAFVTAHQHDPDIVPLINDVRKEIKTPNASIDEVIAALLQWIKEDKKITSLKSLQGHIWKAGYEKGDYTGHLYPDAAYWLTQWHQAGLELYVYSSGSVLAQQLLYRHSDAGDLSVLFKGHFDTHIGGKKETQSYHNISQILNIPGDQLLFLSDISEELDAAQAAGWNTVLVARNNVPQTRHITVQNFAEINPFGERKMSQLTVYNDNNPTKPILHSEDPALITDELKNIGVQFRRWQATNTIGLDSNNEEILNAYKPEIEALIKEAGYQSFDVINVNPDNPNKNALRQKFLEEHIHVDDEVRFFVRGSGQFYLHADNKVYIILCQQNDLINVPAQTKHWFDMSANPQFTCIRLFNDAKGWEAQLTGDSIAGKFPLFVN